MIITDLREEVERIIKELLIDGCYEEDIEIIMMGLDGDETDEEIVAHIENVLLQLGYY